MTTFNKAIIHLGFHKTGTTFIQRNLKENNNLLAKAGILYPPRRDFHLALSRNILAMNTEATAFTEFEAASRSHLFPFVPQKKRFGSYSPSLLISEEDLAGYFNLAVTQEIYPDIAKFVANLLTYISAKEIEIIVTIRNYAEFILSTYNQLIKKGEAFELDDYVSKIDMNRISWFDTVTRLDEQLKKQLMNYSLTIFDFDRENCPQELLFYALDQLNAPKIKIQNIHANPSYSEKGFQLAKFGNEILNEEERVKLRAFLEENFSQKRGDKRPISLQASIKDELDLKYRSDRQKLENLSKENPHVSFFGAGV